MDYSITNGDQEVLTTRHIAKMIEKNEFPIEKIRVAKSISTFLSKNEQFDFANSRIHDFEKEIKAVAGEDYDEVVMGLKSIQRLYQLSSGRDIATKVLLENGLHSAYEISRMSREAFVEAYGKALGGGPVASEIHRRASHIKHKSQIEWF